MKNIHIIPTDKPSRLAILHNGNLHIGTNFKKDLNVNPQNIYITSDEKPKSGDWSLYAGCKLHKCIEDIIGDEFKKIILTTDQDLIKDGVQAIDDEFLQWFVKNPSCKEIKVESIDTFKKTNDIYVDEITGGNYHEIIKKYKLIIPKEEIKEYYCKSCGITQDEPFGKCHESHKHCSCELRIIPKEEPKQIKCYCGHTTYCDCGPLEEPKQETLEEHNYLQGFINQFEEEGEHQELSNDDWTVSSFLKWLEVNNFEIHKKTKSVFPNDAHSFEVFAIKDCEQSPTGKEAYIGCKLSNGNFHFVSVPFTEPNPTYKDTLETLKEKVRKAINVIQKLPIDEVSKQSGISALKLILNE